ncbi:SUMF1/EgtB/PvdO family nonheme iron enzyme [Glycomyces xiaoerkulensis]|uniref:SUMF1/EgtB/PvdO family nonheme iron enzyme n=1 Tax=Glycomyces xiaoerkulensis TaxID=2038139 RepID=UPI0018E45CD7|nr:SUMF1/EgtB/PvdO family nonheme iron enzyme [Glycomyces xiaoerkulensis]
MVTIEQWTGQHAAALRRALRLSIREFAKLLGINERTVSKWEERGAAVVLRPINQSGLDTALESSDRHAQQRFATIIASEGGALALGTESPALPHTNTIIRHTGDGKSMAHVPAGVYLSGDRDAPVWLAEFYIDVYPVTNTEYANFAQATGHPAPNHWNGRHPPAELAEHPVVHVTHLDAAAYASWAGKQSPTAMQWEKAARGEEGNRYPWGNQATAAKCNTRESGLGCTTPVNCYHSGTSAYGVYDLAGNVWEWTASETTPGRFILKGSAFTSPFIMAEAAAVNDAAETMSDDDTGFRCTVPGPTVPEPG